MGLRPAGESRRSYSDQLSTDSVNAGRSVPRPTWSTQTAKRAGRMPREETHGRCQRDPAALGEAVAWQGLVCAPGEPQVQPSREPLCPWRGSQTLPGGPPGGSTPSASPEAARAGKQTVLEGKGFLNRRVSPGLSPCYSLRSLLPGTLFLLSVLTLLLNQHKHAVRSVNGHSTPRPCRRAASIPVDA